MPSPICVTWTRLSWEWGFPHLHLPPAADVGAPHPMPLHTALIQSPWEVIPRGYPTRSCPRSGSLLGAPHTVTPADECSLLITSKGEDLLSGWVRACGAGEVASDSVKSDLPYCSFPTLRSLPTVMNFHAYILLPKLTPLSQKSLQNSLVSVESGQHWLFSLALSAGQTRSHTIWAILFAHPEYTQTPI